MQLAIYLSESEITHKAMADRLGVSSEAVRLWCLGRVIPRRNIMAKIAEATEGKVTAADFYHSEAA